MSYRRSSSLFAAATTAATAVLTLGASAASAAPIPLPHHRSEDGITGAGHHGPDGRRVSGRDLGDAGLSGPAPLARAPHDHLTVTVRDSGSERTDGTFELFCHPHHGSTHHDAQAACKKLDSMTRWGRDPFAPVPQNAQCTMMYGGPATAHVTGTWAGRPVNADFRRTNGCEINRWGRFEPLLPVTTS
ncbi:SSI family serine proteinase inhibitor [Streptomyces sp. NPDC056411]|uniref:SSI family serine proteinase inhibitor n=1 Tax=Streptomyces sp. NPDC056411 TaxID=3345813 RepID=UPI0035D7B3E7